MIADIAHELRTPLRVIQANLEGILDGVLPTSSEEIASLHEKPPCSRGSSTICAYYRWPKRAVEIGTNANRHRRLDRKRG